MLYCVPGTQSLGRILGQKALDQIADLLGIVRFGGKGFALVLTDGPIEFYLVDAFPEEWVDSRNHLKDGNT